jgi:hypothetical protein
LKFQALNLNLKVPNFLFLFLRRMKAKHILLITNAEFLANFYNLNARICAAAKKNRKNCKGICSCFLLNQ